jgi:hypothetical protein
LIAGVLVPAIGFLTLTFSGAIEGSILAGVAFFLFLAAYLCFGFLISPRRFEIYSDRLELVFPCVRFPLRFDSIADIESISWRRTIRQPGMVVGDFRSPLLSIHGRLTSQNKTWLLPGREPRVLLTVANHDAFIAALESARAKYAAASEALKHEQELEGNDC